MPPRNVKSRFHRTRVVFLTSTRDRKLNGNIPSHRSAEWRADCRFRDPRSVLFSLFRSMSGWFAVRGAPFLGSDPPLNCRSEANNWGAKRVCCCCWINIWCHRMTDELSAASTRPPPPTDRCSLLFTVAVQLNSFAALVLRLSECLELWEFGMSLTSKILYSCT